MLTHLWRSLYICIMFRFSLPCFPFFILGFFFSLIWHWKKYMISWNQFQYPFEGKTNWMTHESCVAWGGIHKASFCLLQVNITIQLICIYTCTPQYIDNIYMHTTCRLVSKHVFLNTMNVLVNVKFLLFSPILYGDVCC